MICDNAQKAGTYRDMDGNLNARAGRIPEFDAVVRGFSTLDVTVQVDVLEGRDNHSYCRFAFYATVTVTVNCFPSLCADVRARRESLNHINQADALVYFDFMKGLIVIILYNLLLMIKLTVRDFRGFNNRETLSHC